MKRFSTMIAFVTMTVAGGCWTTTVKSGRPVGPVAPGADDSWHSVWSPAVSSWADPTRS